MHGLDNTEILILKTKALGEWDQFFSCLPLIYGVANRDFDSSVEECQEWDALCMKGKRVVECKQATRHRNMHAAFSSL